jgi:argininosuccinate synthase
MKIILAYSGGLDTSVILTWLKQNYDAEIIAFCADIGQEEELDGLTEKALRAGAAKCIIEDLREEFARDFIFPMFSRGCDLRGTILSWDEHRASAHCEAHGRDCARRISRGDCTWRDGEGE